jgi:glycosyltransferase involved in cell wall biosynthesis
LQTDLHTRPRILLLIPHLGGGGAEHVTQLLACGLSQKKYELHLGLATSLETGPVNETESGATNLSAGVEIHRLGARRVRGSALRLVRLVRRLQPDLILSGMAHLNFLVLLLRPFLGSNVRILVRQNSTVSSALTSGELPRPTRLFYRLLYPRADRIICQSQAMAEDLVQELGLKTERMTVLPNPVEVDAIRARVSAFAAQGNTAVWTGPGPHLLTVGRLAAVKGFDLLLEALPAVRNEFPGADLTIVGQGEEQKTLEAQARGLDLASAVRFTGQVAQPEAYFPGAALFVLSSRHEGLPNALLEAAAAGLPIIALPSSQGLTDLLRNQPGAWLAPEISSAALAASLLSALRTLAPGERFTHSFIDAFRIERSIQAYEDLIDSVLKDAAAREVRR